jgi:predicted short-subunit dehydrogenase-like oxidoreductase (DUF2520 family)
MKYEVTITVSVHPDADFAGTDDELETVYSLIESAVFDTDDLIMDDLEVREHG